MKVAILTGAGASYGAGKIVPKKPPLGRELYKELTKRYPSSWGNFPWQFASLFRRDFELGMQQVWEKRLDLVQRLMIDMACYFSEFGPSNDGSDCYSRLATRIAEKNIAGQIAFATLNYECIMDVAAYRAGLKIAYAGFPPHQDKLMIWKLHGACNLLPVLGLVGGTPTSTVRGGTLVARGIYEGPVRPYDLPEVRNRYVKEKFSLPPAMCVYMPGKPTQSAWKVIDNMRNQWASWMKEIDVITVIGVRPNLIESYVWQPIIDSQAEVWYVGGQDGDYSELKSHLGDRFIYLAPTFESAIITILDNLNKS